MVIPVEYDYSKIEYCVESGKLGSGILKSKRERQSGTVLTKVGSTQLSPKLSVCMSTMAAPKSWVDQSRD